MKTPAPSPAAKSPDWRALTLDEVLTHLEVKREGLEDAEAATKLEKQTVLGFCRRAREGGKSVELDGTQVEAEALRLAGDGYRILAIAAGETSDTIP